MKTTFRCPTRLRARRGFTLPEILIASFISAIAIGAAISISISATRTFLIDSDYLEIGGRQRRLSDDLIEKVSRAQDMAVYYDIDSLVWAEDQDRGDCLVVMERDMGVANGPITALHCYYLAYTTRGATGPGPVALWYFRAVPLGGAVTDPVAALGGYRRTEQRQLSRGLFLATLPRPAPPLTTPITPREGIFTMNRASAAFPPSVQVILPTREDPDSSRQKAQSTFTFAVSLRR
jgi:prepilin-type N-terminal cleavage/methylation domain-containing protein